jgi:short subunit dehydrogenase-like uncharacterized protein
MTDQWMIYGANGYTGRLVAQLAIARRQRPILAGRDGTAIRALGDELGLPSRVASLTDPVELRNALGEVAVVAHCAGPFALTAAPMVAACLDAGVHYLDVTGEIRVFEHIYGRHGQAEQAGVVLLPGAGFDVVPTDCLAVLLATELPTASTLELAFLAGGGLSPGTLKTSLRSLPEGNLRRVEGRLRRSAMGEPTRTVDFPSGTRAVAAIPWGDLVSAYRSTGIPNITTYTRLATPGGMAGRAAAAGLGQLLRFGPTRALATGLAIRRVTGPDQARRARSGCEVWGQVRAPDGASRWATLTGPNGYDLTADAVLRAVGYLLAGSGPAGPIRPGAQTPATALGAGFVRELDGVTVSPVHSPHPQ